MWWWVDPIRHLKIIWPAACSPLLQLDKAVSKKSKTKKFLGLCEYNLKGEGMREKTQTSKWYKGNRSPLPTSMPSYSLSNACLPTVFKEEHKLCYVTSNILLINLGQLLRLCHLPASFASSAKVCSAYSLQGTHWRKKKWNKKTKKPTTLALYKKW